MSKWELIGLISEIGAGICGIINFMAGSKINEEQEERIRRLVTNGSNDEQKNNNKQNAYVSRKTRRPRH